MTAHRLFSCLVIFVYCLFNGSTVFAGNPPILTSPSNGSTVSSSALNWQTPSYALYSTNPYRVQVDDSSSFPSGTINKDYYTKNAYYTPVLNEGTWYWRVKVKDSSGTWSDWSSMWSFTLSTTPTPPPTPSPTPAPTSSPTSSPSISSFTISNIPSQINSDQSFIVSVNLSLPNNSSTTFYLKGAFKKADGSNYFGMTKVSGSWVKNGSTYSSQLAITTDSSGNWSGNLEVKPDSEDSGFTGSGDYIFKVGRYTSTGSGPTWSNESTIKIISIESTDQGGTTISNTTSSITNPSTSPQSVNNQITSGKSKSSTKADYKIASIAGVAATATPSASPSTEVKSQKQTNFPLIIGLVLIASGIGLSSYIYLRSHETIFNKFRKRN